MNRDASEIICPIITPFDSDSNPSREYTRIFLDDLREFGIKKIFPLGSNGLFNLMTMNQKKDFLKIIQEEAGDFETIVGVGSQNTAEAVEMAKYAEDLGFGRIVIQPPYYLKSEQSWIMRHFEAIASEFNGKIFIYNIPQFTNSRIEMESISTIIENTAKIEGVKDSSGDIGYFNDLATQFSSKIKIYQGQDDLLLQSLIMGARGGVCGTSNISPLSLEVYKNFIEGNMNRAMKAQKLVIQLFKTINYYPFPTMVYATFYRKHNLKGKLPEPITTMGKIVETKIIEVINFPQKVPDEE